MRHRRSWLVGENLAWGETSRSSPRSIVRAWMHSHGHRANVLNPRFRELGAGVADGAPFGDNIEPAATYDHEFGVTR